MTDQDVIRWSNERLRPFAHEVLKFHAQLSDWLNEYAAGLGDKIYAAAVINPTEPIEDGRESTDYHAVTVNDVQPFQQLAVAVQGVLEATGKLALVQKICTDPLLVK